MLSSRLNILTLLKFVGTRSTRQYVKVYARSVEVGQVHNEDIIWEHIVKHFEESGAPVPSGLRDAVGVALDNLQENAAADLLLPEPGKAIGASITDQIIAVLREQMKDYEAALSRVMKSPEDSSAMNEILRLAYNFASDATGYLRLIVSVCDLKPMVLWATISYHYNLSEAFRLLPWTRSRNKASMPNYVGTISDAQIALFTTCFLSKNL